MERKKITEKEIVYWLCGNPAIGTVTIKKLYEFYGSYENVYHNMKENRLKNMPEMSEKKIGKILEWEKHFQQSLEEYNRLQERGVRFVTHLESEYPERLRNIPRYPAGLFAMGELPKDNLPSVAIVGARGCSAYGEQLAFEFARVFSEENVQVVSGLALGIDGAAHKGSLKGKGEKTSFGVLGCGVNICYPSANYPYYTQMKERGGVISEFPLGCQPLAMNFPMRNRIISGLSDVILLVEAKSEKSGALITVECGLEQGKEIFAIPGRVTDHLSGGCNRLIQQGAHIALSPWDILEYLHIKRDKKLIITEKNPDSLPEKEQLVYGCLDYKAKHLEAITLACGLPVSECMSILLELELGGYVYRSANHYYGKNIKM